MSRNSRRTQIPKSVESEAVPPQQNMSPHMQQEKPNPFGLSFAVATEIVHLPSGGKFYEQNSPISGLESLEIKSMTAKEEDIMINDSFIEQGIVFDKLIDSLMITQGVRAADLLDCDKVAILVSARKTGYGDGLDINHDCPECGELSTVEVSLSAMLEKTKTEKFEIEDTDQWKYDTTSETLEIVLPVTGLSARVKLLSREDIQFLQKSKEQKDRLNLPYNETIEFIRRALVSVNDIVDMSDLSKLIDILPAADARMIKYAHNMNVPAFDTKQNVTCPSCSTEVEKEVPFSVGWFWSN
jgi:hypothetical protein